jgi:hypothetical protein
MIHGNNSINETIVVSQQFDRFRGHLSQNAHADEAPFLHLRFDRVFPDDFYAEMLEAMPVADDYRAMSGKSKMGSSMPDGKPTRSKIDLFPEYIRHLPPKKAGSLGDRRPYVAF